MSCRLQSRITAILFLATTLPLCLPTHGSVFDSSQSVQVRRNSQKGSNAKEGPKINLETIGQQSNAASRETLSRWFSQDRHPVPDETKPFKLYKSSSALHQSIYTSMLTPRQSGTDVTGLFQSDSPGFGVQEVQERENLSSSSVTKETKWLQMRPLVQCSPAAIVLTAKGWDYVHLLVNRVGTSPVSVLHLPSHCGYNVKATWRDLVLTAPYDGCYVLQQNGSYVLPLLWWGMPVSISCPKTSVSATLSGFCSYLGISLKIEGAQRDIKKYSIKVNEEWVPLVSSTCAYHMDSAPEDLILFIPFTVQCAKDGGSTYDVLLGGKMYILSCQPHWQQSMPMVYPPYQHFFVPLSIYPYYHHLHNQLLAPDSNTAKTLKQIPKPQAIQEPHTGLWPPMLQFPYVPPMLHPPQVPPMLHPPQVPPMLHPPQVPPMLHPPQVPPMLHPPQVPPMLHPPQVPHKPQHPQVPHKPQHPQAPHKPQHPQAPHKPQPQPSQAPHKPQPQPSQAPHKPQPQPQPSQAPHKPQPQPSQAPHKPQPQPQPSQAPHKPQPQPQPSQAPHKPQPQPSQAPHKPQPQPQPSQAPHKPQPQPSQVPHKPQPQPLPSQAPHKPQPRPSQTPHKPQPLPSQAPQPWPPQAPHKPWPPQAPHKPQLSQAPHKPQLSQLPQQFRTLVLANDSSQLSPVLTCKRDHLRASLPFAKINTIKVKDVKRKVWVPVSSAPAHCGYSLQRKGRGVVFSSPLPACHSYTASSSLLSLSLKLWDPVIQRHHAVQLQCPYTSPSSIMTASSATTASLIPKPISTLAQPAMHEIQPLPPQKPLGSLSKPSKPKDSTIHSQKPIAPSLHPSKPTAPLLTWMFQTTPLVSQMHQPQVLCHSKDMSVTLPPGAITGLTVQSPTVGIEGDTKTVLLDEAPSLCGYSIKKTQNGGINILLPYTSCHMAHQDGQYQIMLKYQTVDGRRVEAFLSCQVPKYHECNLPSEHQLSCGSSSVSVAECHELGCCYSPDSQACYYPMDECTADRHFVFSIPATLTEPPLSPALLVAAGNSSCTPQRVVADLAIFKIPLDGCGTHKYEVGNTMIYMLEILNTLHSVTLNYGSITRDSPFRLLVECRYLPGTVASVGYLVKSPSLGPSIQAQGVFGVQLRIAKDQHYSSYYPQYHRPLRKLLGKPLYLEVRLLNPLDPSAVLLVHYCVAYPRSAHSAWVLIYDGCPNPLDVTSSHEPPPTPPEGLAKHIRRFAVSTFQFLENNKKETSPGETKEVVMLEKEEEIYFMCATEVCLPSEGPCVEGCIEQLQIPQL